MMDRYQQSQRMLAKALEVIPLGAQTFSKSCTQFPVGVSPHFTRCAKGARLWDVDDNEYLDFVSALGAVLLGYQDSDVDQAVRKALESGMTFSLSHELEIEVAERLIQLVPCAEQVRFGKNGTDATSGAVRLARAFTGRDRIATCGYHGWQDWSIAVTSRNLGIPDAVKALSHSFPYNDTESLKSLLAAHPGEFAAVIMEPMNAEYPAPGYLEEVRALCNQQGALLIFDETITGFRLGTGGAQALFGVTPDLATFGKGMANGLPLSAIVGPRHIMRLMEEIFFSGTFSGETLSLAAAKATLDKIRNEAVPEQLERLGRLLQDGLRSVIDENRLGDLFRVAGHPSWTFLVVTAAGKTEQALVKTFLLQELFAAGVLCLGSHNLSASHTDADIDQLLSIYRQLLPRIHELLREEKISDELHAEPLQPLFTIR